MIQIERIGADRAARLAALQARTFRDAYEDVHGRSNVDTYCKANFTAQKTGADLKNPGNYVAMAFQGDDALGYAYVSNTPCPEPLEGGSAELRQIYTLGLAYRHGLGDQLLHWALDTIRGMGHRWLWLTVADSNERARAFYDAEGFTEIGPGRTIWVGRDRMTSTNLAREV